MNRHEFIDILRKTLEVELPANKVAEHIEYYDQYISSMGDSQKQEEEIERIGDPHLIAKTIIDSFQDSSEYKYTGQANSNYYKNESTNDWNSNYNYSQDYNEQVEEREEKSIWSKIKGIAIFTLVIFIIIMLLRFAFNLFIRIGIPVLICYFIYKFVKERIK